MDLRNPTSFTYANDYPEIVEKLKALPRTGWVQWQIQNPENVWEHIVATRELAMTYRQHLNLSDTEFTDLIDMIEIHDWPEALVGDGVILGDEPNVEELRKEKKNKEMAAMKSITENTRNGRQILNLYKRYQNGSDKVARKVKQLDKLQAVIKAAEYEKTYNKKGLTAEFIRYTRQLIHDPFLLKEFEKLAIAILSLIFISTGFSFINT